MKILKQNLVKDSTITGTEVTQYPLVNLCSKYMEKLYKPGQGNGLIATVDFGEEKTVSAVVFAYTNATYQESDTITITPLATDTITMQPLYENTLTISGEISIIWTLKNAAGVAVASDFVCVDNEICFSALESGSEATGYTPVPVQARYLEVYAKGQPTDLYIGGLGAGEYYEHGVQDNNASMSLEPIGNAGRTTEGFVIGRDDFALRQWEATLMEITPAQKLELESLIRQYGSATPLYASEIDKNEPPIHGTFSRIGQFRRDTTNNEYSMGVTILEAR